VQRPRLERDLRALADDALEGRRTGEPGAERAAQYIARAFREAGLESAGTDGFLQPFEATTGVRLGEGNRLRLRVRGATFDAVLGRDFLPLAFSESGEFEGPALFAGYGITAREPPYDDYAGVDAQGRAVFVLRHEPRENSEDSPFAGRDLSVHSELRRKALNAHQHGARVLVLINDALGHAPAEDVLLPLAEEESGGGHVVAVHVRRGWLDGLPARIVPGLRRWQKQVDRTLTPRARTLEGVTVDIRVEVRREKHLTANVLGMVRGADPARRDQVVLVGAHYDGLGRGGSRSLDPEALGQVHNGADDNASGVSALLEMARVLNRRRAELRRSVLFAAFTGEEMGLLGSSHYVSQPAVPLERTVVMLNLDMVGRGRGGHLHVGGVASSAPFEPLLRALEGPYDLRLDLAPGQLGPGDGAPFYARRLPVLSFFTGAHADYHRPSDDAGRIDYETLARVAGLAADVVLSLANLPEAPVFAGVEEEGFLPGEGYGGQGSGAYLGALPDFAESEQPGVLLSGVRGGSPAERAGLRFGDRIIRVGNLTIDTLYDLTYALEVHRAGERVRIRYLRDSRELETGALLEKSPGAR
jgi:hypothetical protein